MTSANGRFLQCGGKRLALDRPLVMGILNVTPDSFSDGGRFYRQEDALKQAQAMVDQGADIIDVGGESTRPGANDVGTPEELDRVVPIVEALAQRFDAVVSVDTSKAQVMAEAASAGAGMINDVRALREPGALKAASQTGLPVCLMHMQGEPRTMQHSPQYDDVVTEVCDFLSQRIVACVQSGISEGQILIDPGFGFGKNLQHNLGLLSRLDRLCDIAPVLTGLSRKRMFAEILGNNAADRLIASVTGALLCVQRGASIVRVHDVGQTVDALKVHDALLSCA